MKRAIFSVVAVALIAGCGGQGPAVPKTTASQQPPAIAQNAPTRTGQQNVAQNQPAPNGEVATIPEGARYSIECARYGGSDHVQQSRLAKEQMIRKTGRKDFYVVHNADQSVLFLGYYTDIDRTQDAVEAKRSADDLDWLESFKSPMGGRMFTRPLKVSIATTDPDAPAEWDLAKLNIGKTSDSPDYKFWTVVIAAYTNDVRDENGRPADRKQMAVDTVRAARAQKIEAYYYHGESMSQICIGVWPRNALREQDMANAESRSEAKANSGEVLVVSPAPLGDKFTDQLQRDHDVKVVQPKVEIRDASLAKTLAMYDTYAVNSEAQMVKMTDPQTKKEVIRPQPSFLTQIPQSQGLLPTRNAEADPNPTMINPISPGSGNTGRLQGLPR